MAGCAQFNCSAEYIVPFKANPDISGIGVIIAFFVAAWFTCTIVLIGYLFVDNGVPDSYLNDLDLYFLSKTIPLKNHFKRKWFPKSLGPPDETPISRAALQKSALMLSDQQMITGVAVLIIGFGMHCSISQYHFEIVADLASMAFNVLQATILVTLPILRETPVMRHWRAIWITAHFIFVFVSQVVTYHPGFLWSYGMPTQCVWESIGSTDYGPTLAPMLIYLFSITWAYLDIMSSFYPRQLGWSSYPGYLVEKVLRAPAKLHSATEKRVSRQGTRAGVVLWRVLSAVTFVVFVAALGISEVAFSVFFSIVRVFSMVLWASLYIIRYRTSDDVSRVEGMQGDEDEWTVGQIMPLMLLLLPLFGILETYCDNWVSYRERVSHEKPSTADPAPDANGHRESHDDDDREETSHAERTSSERPAEQDTSHSIDRTFYVSPVFNSNRRAVFRPQIPAPTPTSTGHAKYHNDPDDLKLLGKASTFELEYSIYERWWFRYGLLAFCMVTAVGLMVAACFGFAI
ncbi:ADP-ribosylation factor GTPase activating protein, ER-Golgi transport [Arachnomyces sp. PD_36]|nr:ADP-ribosylation factor GTPase activating protein, ER-Golgi transport [Arachnomyces sp. PD_36]